MELTEKDKTQIQQNGISLERIESQIENFKTGFPFSNISAAATLGHGIVALNDSYVKEVLSEYKSYTGARLKFVPSSGAATRMFKTLFECIDEIKKKGHAQFDDRSLSSAYHFFSNIEKFAFYPELERCLNTAGKTTKKLLEEKKYVEVLEALLTQTGLNYGEMPKGLLVFHQYSDSVRTALEEHLVEGAMYAASHDGVVNIHLTVSPEHQNGFNALVKKVVPRFEKELNVKINVVFSVQKKSTDTIAVDLDNQPFRNSDGSILFRPGGHGALIENLNDCSEPLIFVKNIDNVVPDHLKAETTTNKQVIAGTLLKIKEICHTCIQRLESGNITNDEIKSITELLKHKYYINLPQQADNTKEAWYSEMIAFLNRPIRVCGMVRNEGEPGGGPFWVTDKHGVQSLQIVESSQINLKTKEFKELFNRSTHFNPVDLVCWTWDYKNVKFDLRKFVDPETGFIAEKSKDGRILKAQELPGLWNGAMAHWITVFVEVPLITFNPVKSVNDLLRNEHQPA